MGLYDDVVRPTASAAIEGVSRLLSEGASDDRVVSSLRTWFEGDKTNARARMRRGVNDRVGTNKVAPAAQGGGYEALSDDLRIEQDLIRRFADYEEMDDYPEVASAIDIYADDATITDTVHNQSIWAVSEDAVVRQLLNHMLHKVLKIEEDIWPLSRGVVKYGNNYGENLVTSEEGIIGVNWLSTPTCRRVESKKGQLLGYVQDDTGKFRLSKADFGKMMKATSDGTLEAADMPDGVSVFEPWEIAHWRLRSKHIRSTYGHSVLEPVRWVWRRLVMLEDTMLVYKLTRAPARYAFYVDVGDLPTEEGLAYVKRLKAEYKKRRILRAGQQNRMDFRKNPLSPHEDFWFPTRGGKESTRLDVISGPDYQAIDDVEYFRTKLLAGLKVPARYIGLGDDTNRATLSQEDVRFARTVLRIQREIRNGLKQVCRVHLAALGIDPDTVEWDLRMTVPSSIFELAQIEVRNAQADLADRLQPWATKEWILKSILNFTDDDAATMVSEKNREQREMARGDAEVQSSIMQDFPGVAPEALPTLAQAGGGAEGGQATESNTKDDIRRVRDSEKKMDSLLERWDRVLDKTKASADLSRDASKELRAVARNLDHRMRKSG